MTYVSAVEYRGGHVLKLRFTDGLAGEVDLGSALSGPVLGPLRNTVRFSEAFLDEELGTVCWPGGADLAPEFLYASVARAKGVADRP